MKKTLLSCKTIQKNIDSKKHNNHNTFIDKISENKNETNIQKNLIMKLKRKKVKILIKIKKIKN